MDEMGWLIELGASPPSAPAYWVGENRISFDYDHMKAVRFKRREDAQRVADGVLNGLEVRIAEHGWCK